MKSKILLSFSLLVLYSFSQNYNMTNGTVTTCSGYFYDSGGPSGNYSNNENLTFTIQSNNGNKISVTFQQFTLENGPDYLQIYDGPNTSCPLIGTFTGSTSPGTITSTGTSLTFKFYSNSSSSYAGWSASISCTSPAPPTYTINNVTSTITTCDAVLYDDGGPSANYSNLQNNIAKFCPSNPSHYLVVNFPYQLNLAPDDTLFIYSGDIANNNLIAKFTKNNKGASIASPSPGECITFKFVSNNLNVAEGFQAIISCSPSYPTPQINMGDGARYVCSGYFYDSGGPSANYSNNENKILTLASNNGSKIQISFQNFSTEGAIDYLEIYDGPNTSAPLIGKFWGSYSPGTISSTGTSLTFKFYSDASTSYAGWSASISCTSPAPPTYSIGNQQTIHTCNAVFYDDGGGNNNYSNFQNNTITFCSDYNSFIKVTFNQMILENDDSLYIYDGNSTNSNLLAVLTSVNCSNFSQSFEITSQTSSCLTFKFKSNDINTNKGWQGIISCIDSPQSLSINNLNGVFYTCNGKFYDSGGPNSNYSNSENRITTICSNSGCPVSVSFEILQTETYDKLYVYDGNSISSPLIGTYYGTQVPPTFTSTNNCLTFKFTSDASTTYQGWRSNINCQTAQISANPSNNACVGQTVTLTSTPGVSYLWNTGQTTQSIQVTTPGIYSVTVVSSNNCYLVSNPIIVNFYSYPPSTISIGGATEFCEGGYVVLSAPAGYSYNWNNGFTSQSITVTNSGQYWVTVTSQYNCHSVSDTVAVTVYPTPPIPTITQVYDTLFTQSGFSNYQWYFNDNLVYSGSNNYYIPQQNGYYYVVVFNEYGCSSTSSKYFYQGSQINEENILLSVTPNPFSEHIFISIYGSYKKYNCTITDLVGTTIYEFKLSNKNTHKVDLSSLKKGIYLLKIKELNYQLLLLKI
ncbi:MAG: T9SS type A sorting domain-containing protein [Bacteroidales bacterium]|nr:T9SS type A sorting domain-containing protein [Bacteroidales bacterium]